MPQHRPAPGPATIHRKSNIVGSSALRFLFFLLTGILLFTWFTGNDDAGPEAGIQHPTAVEPSPRASYQYCELQTAEYQAQFTTRGATLKRFKLFKDKYVRNGVAHDLSTTPQPGTTPGTPEEHDPQAGANHPPGTAHEFRQQLFVQFRSPTSPGVSEALDWNLGYDSVDWQLTQQDDACLFTYKDEQVELTKRITIVDRPYELSVETTIKNLAETPKAHAFAIDTVDWWLDSEVSGSLFRVSPYITTVECIGEDGSAHRKRPEDFTPDEFKEPEFAATGPYRWFQAREKPDFAAVSNAYFAHALIPVEGPTVPVCQLQIEPRKPRGAEPGAFYRARLAYPVKNLAPGETATYQNLAYIGPKERRVLAHAGGADHDLSQLIDLGFFASIAKVLVSFLLQVYSFIPNWGVAIILLTVCARILLFPLAIPGIRTMIKMRELKPEMDAINEKYKDDVRAKGLAQMELWRKHGLSPMDQVKGCLPQLATMPVWFALYTTLQTAVELYNIPFLWFPDLSEPDPYFILPFVIGGTYFLQQKIMPFQGDPAQRKMMMYFMPAMFTVFMLFLPSGLGIYMFTNSVLAIVQQQAVEVHARKTLNKGAVQVRVAEDDKTSKATPSGKRKSTST